MTARRIYVPDAQPSRDPNGRALPAKLYFYEPTGTYDTPKAVYTDNTLTTAHAFPVLSNAAGRFPAIWADDAETFDVVWADQVFNQRLGAWTNITPLSDAMVASAATAEAAADEAEASADAAADSAQDSAQSANEAAAVVATLEGYTEGVVTNATNVNFTRSGAGAVVRSVKARLDDWVSVKDFGAAGDGSTNDTAAIQAAIDYCAAGALVFNNMNPSAPGRTLYFPPGIYRISSTLTLKAGVTLQGSGVFSSQIFLAPSANCDIIKSENYDSLVGSGKAWYESGVPCYFGIADLNLYGNKSNNTTGSGVKIYGYGYDISNVIIADCAETGFVSRHETGGDAFNRNWLKNIECLVRGLTLWGCRGAGLEWRGPTDAALDSVFIGECGQSSSPGNVGALISSPIYVGHMHVYAIGSPTPNNGSNAPVGVKIAANARFETLVSETIYGRGVSVEQAWFVKIGDLQLYNNSYNNTAAEYDLFVDNNSFYFQCSTCQINLGPYDHPAIGIQSPYATFGSVKIVGDPAAPTTYTKTGFFQASTATYLSIASLHVQNMRGVGAIGAAFNQGGAAKGCKISAQIIGCTTGCSPGGGFSHGADISITIEKATAAQAYSSFAFPAVTYGRQTITQISETGSGSAG